MSKLNNFYLVFGLILLMIADMTAQDFNSYLIRYKGQEQVLVSKMNKIGLSCKKSINIHGMNVAKDDNKFLSTNQTSALGKLDNYYTIPAGDFVKLSQVYEIMKTDESLISIEPNYIFKIDKDDLKPNDSLYFQLWWIQAVNTEKAWKTASGKGIIIGLIDTGIDFDHPDLRDNLWVNSKEDINGNGRLDPWEYTEIRGGVAGDFNGKDDDGNGVTDDVIGYDFVNQEFANFGDYSQPDPIPEDQGEHGTLVAGVMSAVRNNGIGIAGIAYNAKILTAKAFDITGNAESDDIARAIIYAVLNGAKVLNFSFGERNEAPIVYDAIRFAREMGCVMVGSSGNNGWNNQHFPSDHPEVISVGGIDETGRWYSRANYGSMLDITAPSVSILTTDIGGSYKTTNGTSLSSPMVSAAAALMLELNPGLTPEEVRGILQMTAKREFNAAWNVYYGAGVLDIGNAVNSAGASIFEISYPLHEQYINKDVNPDLTIRGTAASSLFDGYDLAIGTGIMPEQWIYESDKINTQMIDGTLGEINLSNLNDGIYTLALRVYQKNTNIIERRTYITITSASSKVDLTSFNAVDAYYNEKRVVIIGAVTDRKCSMILKYSKTDSDTTMVTRQFDFNSQYHTIVLGEEILPDTDYNGEAVFYTSAGDSTIHKFIIRKKNDIFQTTNFSRKDYSLPRTYLLNEVSDLYNNGKKHLAVNDLSTLFIGESRIYEFDNNSFQLRDTSAEGWIAAGLGDSNGDGIPEIFAASDGRSTVKQGKSYGENPFGNEIYRSPVDSTFWAEQIFDLDGDGIDELIGYKYDNNLKNYYAVYKFMSGKYQLFTRAELPENLKNVSLTRGSAIADFDSDGNYELVFANTRGHLFIYEFKNKLFSLEFVDSVTVASSIQFIEKPDIDGDGKPEIMQAYAGTNKLFGQNETGTPLWTVRVIKSSAPNTYDKDFWSENIYGVRIGASRQGAFFRNGSASGDLNMDGKDEIIISAFPNLYVWTLDSIKGKMKPMWQYPTTLSNSAVIYDFDGNGINEIGISTFSNTSFFEFDKNFKGPTTPKNFEGWAETQTSAYFQWDAMPDAKEYILFTVDRTVNPPQAVEQARTSSINIVLKNLTPDTFYEFVLASFNPDLADNMSDFTEIVEIFTFPAAKPISVTDITSESLMVNFSGKLKGNYIKPEYFVVLDSIGNFFSYAKTAIISNDTSIIITIDGSLISGKYYIKNYKFKDYFGNPVAERQMLFEYQPPVKDDELYMLSLQFVSETLLRIKFSEKVDVNTAQDDEHYKMQPIGRILYAEVDESDNQYVLLNISQEIRYNGARGKNYTITASDMYSQSGKPMTKGAGNTLGFVISSDDLLKVYVYPNPIKLSENPEIYFANLTNRATVTIMTTDGADILTLTESDGNGGIEWDGRDKNGNLLPTGIYLFRANGTNLDGKSVFEETGKFVILQ
ncbi:MAG: S8 family serine peptidase [Candidatus Kapabacteria bacterium]|nr:S8 family serine peptidase [Candidatus Kapabacteria bacterium]